MSTYIKRWWNCGLCTGSCFCTNATAPVLYIGIDFAAPEKAAPGTRRRALHVGGTDEGAARFAALAAALRRGVRMPACSELRSALFGARTQGRCAMVPRAPGRRARNSLPRAFSFYQGAW